MRFGVTTFLCNACISSSQNHFQKGILFKYCFFLLFSLGWGTKTEAEQNNSSGDLQRNDLGGQYFTIKLKHFGR